MGIAVSTALRDESAVNGAAYGSLETLGGTRKLKKKPVLVLAPEELEAAHAMFHDASAELLGEKVDRTQRPSPVLGLAPMEEDDVAEMDRQDANAEEADIDLPTPEELTQPEDMHDLPPRKTPALERSAGDAEEDDGLGDLSELLNEEIDVDNRIFPSLPAAEAPAEEPLPVAASAKIANGLDDYGFGDLSSLLVQDIDLDNRIFPSLPAQAAAGEPPATGGSNGADGSETGGHEDGGDGNEGSGKDVSGKFASLLGKDLAGKTPDKPHYPLADEEGGDASEFQLDDVEFDELDEDGLEEDEVDGNFGSLISDHAGFEEDELEEDEREEDDQVIDTVASDDTELTSETEAAALADNHDDAPAAVGGEVAADDPLGDESLAGEYLETPVDQAEDHTAVEAEEQVTEVPVAEDAVPADPLAEDAFAGEVEDEAEAEAEDFVNLEEPLDVSLPEIDALHPAVNNDDDPFEAVPLPGSEPSSEDDAFSQTANADSDSAAEETFEPQISEGSPEEPEDPVVPAADDTAQDDRIAEHGLGEAAPATDAPRATPLLGAWLSGSDGYDDDEDEEDFYVPDFKATMLPQERFEAQPEAEPEAEAPAPEPFDSEQVHEPEPESFEEEFAESEPLDAAEDIFELADEFGEDEPAGEATANTDTPGDAVAVEPVLERHTGSAHPADADSSAPADESGAEPQPVPDQVVEEPASEYPFADEFETDETDETDESDVGDESYTLLDEDMIDGTAFMRQTRTRHSAVAAAPRGQQSALRQKLLRNAEIEAQRAASGTSLTGRFWSWLRGVFG